MKILPLFTFLILAFPALAQQDEEVPEVIQQDPKALSRIKAAHAAYITDRLALTPEEAEKFWPVYREYAQKRQEIRQQLREAKKNGADDKSLLDLDLKVKQQQLDLEKDYSARFQKIVSPQKLLHLRQAEGDFRRVLLRQIQQRQQLQERRQLNRDRSQQRLQQRNN
jgi:hypothetical protein